MIGAAALSSLLSLEGRTALVSGGSGGIGSTLCAALCAAGARVLSLDRPGREPPPDCEGLACDLGRAGEVRGLFRDRGPGLESLDVLVHAAGITRDAILWKMEDDAWSEVLRANLDSAFFLLRETAPLLRAAAGSVVLIGSINGLRGKVGQANYAASKAGLIGLARSAARELGPSGVRVNVIAPGWIDTPMTAALPAELRRAAEGEAVLGRLGEPRDVAHAALFLASEMSRQITGQVLRVDGGQLIG